MNNDNSFSLHLRRTQTKPFNPKYAYELEAKTYVFPKFGDAGEEKGLVNFTVLPHYSGREV
jgi:hypothetical protein